MMKSIVTTKSGETQTPLTLELLRGFNVSSHLAPTSNQAETNQSVTDTPGYCLVYNLSKPLDTAYRCVNIRLTQFKAQQIKPKVFKRIVLISNCCCCRLKIRNRYTVIYIFPIQ